MGKVIPLDINMINKTFFERGYIPLSKEYINSKTLLKYICPKHKDYIQEITWYRFNKQGQGCRYCAIDKNIKNNKKYTFDDVLKSFTEKSYEVVSNESDFVNAHSYIEYICKKHRELGIQRKQYRYILAGTNCRKCAMEKRSEKRRLSQEFVENEFKKRGYILHDTYVKNDIVMKFTCEKHPNHNNKICYNALKDGSGCTKCAIEKVSG